MLIELMEDQISLFWDMIKHGMIQSYKIPKEFQQDFSIKMLEYLLSGLSQAWVGYSISDENERKIHFTATTKIIDRKYYGFKVLYIDSTYSYRLMSEEMVNELGNGLYEFAELNNCTMIVTDYSNKRVEDYLLNLGYEKYKSSCRIMVC